MYNCEQFLSLLEEKAPLELSKKMIENGDYDNSGLLVKSHNRIQKILFSLDLTEDAINNAKELGCDTIVTHHPAIYTPISEIGVSTSTKALLEAIKNGLNIFSMHLNLDIAKGGIDECLCQGLNGKNASVLEVISGDAGYGRIATVSECDIEDFVENIKREFGSKKIIFYGNGKVNKIASFCGAGSSSAIKALEKGELDCDTVITSDIAHHNLLSLVCGGKKVVIIPHYVSENYGFNKFYESVLKTLKDAKAYYFADKRFM